MVKGGKMKFLSGINFCWVYGMVLLAKHDFWYSHHIYPCESNWWRGYRKEKVQICTLLHSFELLCILKLSLFISKLCSMGNITMYISSFLVFQERVNARPTFNKSGLGKQHADRPKIYPKLINIQQRKKQEIVTCVGIYSNP